MKHRTYQMAAGALALTAASLCTAASHAGAPLTTGAARAPVASPVSTNHPAPAAPATSPATRHVTQTGQPNQSCGSPSAPNTPGNSAAAPGSAFNPDGQAGTVYAGQQPQNSKNPISVSQYDVACARQPAH